MGFLFFVTCVSTILKERGAWGRWIGLQHVCIVMRYPGRVSGIYWRFGTLGVFFLSMVGFLKVKRGVGIKCIVHAKYEEYPKYHVVYVKTLKTPS